MPQLSKCFPDWKCHAVCQSHLYWGSFWLRSCNALSCGVEQRGQKSFSSQFLPFFRCISLCACVLVFAQTLIMFWSAVVFVRISAESIWDFQRMLENASVLTNWVQQQCTDTIFFPFPLEPLSWCWVLLALWLYLSSIHPQAVNRLNPNDFLSFSLGNSLKLGICNRPIC